MRAVVPISGRSASTLGTKRTVEDVGGGVAGEEDGAMVVVGGDYGGVAEVVEALEIVEGTLAEGFGALEVFGFDGDGAVVAAETHAVGCLAADADGGVVVGVALADDGALGVDDVAVDSGGADVGGAVLDVAGEGADAGFGGVEAAGFDDALLPGVTIEREGDERIDVGYRFCGSEVRLVGALSKRFRLACLVA